MDRRTPIETSVTDIIWFLPNFFKNVWPHREAKFQILFFRFSGLSCWGFPVT